MKKGETTDLFTIEVSNACFPYITVIQFFRYRRIKFPMSNRETYFRYVNLADDIISESARGIGGGNSRLVLVFDVYPLETYRRDHSRLSLVSLTFDFVSC